MVTRDTETVGEREKPRLEIQIDTGRHRLRYGDGGKDREKGRLEIEIQRPRLRYRVDGTDRDTETANNSGTYRDKDKDGETVVRIEIQCEDR